jgi:hypothetical protein
MMFDWFKERWNDLVAWVNSLFADLVQFLTDLPKMAFHGVLDALATVIESIPVPSFVETNGLQDVVSVLPESVQYLLAQSGMAQGLAVLGLGLAFRLSRKLFTLFQW